MQQAHREATGRVSHIVRGTLLCGVVVNMMRLRSWMGPRGYRTMFQEAVFGG